MAETLYLGLDLSTQSLTAVVIDPLNKALEQHTINFDSAYPAYHTAGGIIIGHDPTVVHTDPRMWAEALDDMMAWLIRPATRKRLSQSGCCRCSVASGSVPQSARTNPDNFFQVHLPGLDGFKYQ